MASMSNTAEYCQRTE